jgi:hypothetical protein
MQLILIILSPLFLTLIDKGGVLSMFGGLDSLRRVRVPLPTHQRVQGSLVTSVGGIASLQ